MGSPERHQLPSLESAVELLATLEDGSYSIPELFGVSPELGLAGLGVAYSMLKPANRTVRFKGTSGDTSLSRPPRSDRQIASRAGTTIHVQAGRVTVTFAEDKPS